MNPDDLTALLVAIGVPLLALMLLRHFPAICDRFHAGLLADAISSNEREAARLFVLAKCLDEEGVNADEERTQAQNHLARARRYRAQLAAMRKGASRDT